MYRLFTTAGIISNLYNTEDITDKKNVPFPFLSHIDVKTLDEVTVLQVLHAETKWEVVTNKCSCRNMGVKMLN